MSKQAQHIPFQLSSGLTVIQFVLNLVPLLTNTLESVGSYVAHWYKLYTTTPLSIHAASSYTAQISRLLSAINQHAIVSTGNAITCAQALLTIPMAWCLKYDYPVLACSCVLLQASLNQLHRLVLNAQQSRHEKDTTLQNLTHAVFQNIIRVLCLWTILQETHFEQTLRFISIAFALHCYANMALEITTGIRHVQHYLQDQRSERLASRAFTSTHGQEKSSDMIQSAAMALLCLSTGHLVSFSHWSGMIGVLCLSMTLRFSFASWMKQSQSRHVTITETTDMVSPDALPDSVQHPSPVQKSMAVFNVSDLTKNSMEQRDECDNGPFSSQHDEESSNPMARRVSLPAKWIDGRADKVYTVGCFDLFHDGHRILLQRMRQLGREVIVGVHDSRSIHKLKSRVPVDGTEARMINVRRHADQVYCVAGTDPSNFISSIVHLREGETAIYIRGDDMADFPSRHVVESLMPVQFLPYTTGVSSTQIRKDLYSHIRSDDVEHLEKIN